MGRENSLFDLRDIRLSRNVSVGRREPTLLDLDRMHERGFRAILDLRQDIDTMTGLLPSQEADLTAALGLVYVRFPVSADNADDALLDRFGAEMQRLPKPLFVHCTAGRRAGMFALAHVAIEHGNPGDSMLEMARHLDILYGPREQQKRFADYVDRREKREPFRIVLPATPIPKTRVARGTRSIPASRPKPFLNIAVLTAIGTGLGFLLGVRLGRHAGAPKR
jgi:protein tyrosine phosphatase (PTP) superfamily phosphohydrolase (DUF442 family)